MAEKLIRRFAFILTFLLVGVISAPGIGAREEPKQSPKLLVDSDYFPVLLGKVRTSRKSVDLAMYLWKVTKWPRNKPRLLLRALGAAHRRGVNVRVILEKSSNDRGINRANQKTALLLKQEGVKVFFDSPSVTTHAKLAIIDGRFIFLGSHNLTQSALGRNHELSILLDDPALAIRLTAYLDRLAIRQ